MKSRTAILIGFALLLAYPFALQAQIPRTISYQGVLSDAAGNVKPDGSYSFTFRLYDASTVGTVQWGPETKDLEVSNGLFHTYLGDIEPIPPSLAFDQPYWLSIEVESEELSPRIALTSSPYSFHALRADTALAFSTSADLEINSISVQNTSTTGQVAGDFKILASTNSEDAVWGVTNGTGRAGNFSIWNPDNDDSALLVTTSGLGPAATLQSSNSESTVRVTNSGTGGAGYFHNLNSSSSASVLNVRTDGTGYAGYFVGSVYTTGSYDQASDIRWKQNIAPLAGALNKVLNLKGVAFEWNRDKYPDKGFREGKQIGLIAQEVEKVLPEVVRTDQDGYKAVEYQKITAVLVEAMKEQQTVIEDQLATIDELGNRVALLESKMNILATATMGPEGEKVAEAGEHRFPAINKLLRSYLK